MIDTIVTDVNLKGFIEHFQNCIFRNNDFKLNMDQGVALDIAKVLENEDYTWDGLSEMFIEYFSEDDIEDFIYLLKEKNEKAYRSKN